MKSDQFIGAFVFPDVWRDLEHFRTLVAAFRNYGINALMTESENYEEAAIDAVHDAGLRFYAGVACFSDHSTHFSKLAQRPELWPVLETGELRPQMEWYVGLVPTDRAHQRDVLSTIHSIATRYPIDGLFLDFVRWPLHWEIELRPGQPRPPDSSFDAVTLAAFQQETGLRLPAHLVTPRTQADWIRNRHLAEWVEFKCSVITRFVNEARTVLKGAKHDAELGLFLVPDFEERTEALTGQRLRDIAPLADLVSPMLYHNILVRPPSWIGEALAPIVLVAGHKTLPVLQVDSNRDPDLAADWGPPMSFEDWRTALAEVDGQDHPAGIIVFPGTSLIGNGRGDVLKAVLR